jgi:RNA polymerase sigma factor (sigma-70 family)
MANAQLAVVLRHIRRLAAKPDAEEPTDGQLLDRFVNSREQAAFAALVQRHSGMVLGVCRRLLGHEQDAEDAFQATFLVLAKKAGSIRIKEAVGSWLYGVAYHIAGEARQQAIRRRQRERQVQDMDPPDALARPVAPVVDSVLDEELQRLPDKLRLPLVLCYLQGKSNREAAEALGWPAGSISRRLARGRELLRQNLTRRGVALSGGLLVTVLAQDGAQAAASSALVQSTVQAGLAFAAGKVVAGTISATALNLAQGALKAMAVSKFKIGTALILMCGLLCLGTPANPTGAPAAQAGPQSQGSPADKDAKSSPAAKKKTQTPAEQMTIAGKVLDAAKKPLAGADVAVVAVHSRDRFNPSARQEMPAQGKTDQKGRFRLAGPKASAGQFVSLSVVAGAKGYGLGWERVVLTPKGADAVEVRLQPEQVVTGRLVDLQGLPAAKVKGRVVLVRKTVSDKRPGPGMPYVAIPGGGGGGSGGVMTAPAPFQIPDQFAFRMNPPPRKFPWWPKPITTDAKGRFQVAGFGRNQTIQLLIDDDRFALQDVMLETGAKGKPRPVSQSLAPPHIVEGRVVYEDTRKPAAKVRVGVAARSRNRGGQTNGQTDTQGRFKINSYEGDYLSMRVDPAPGEPYLGVFKYMAWTKGAVREKVSFTLPRGVRVRGKVVDKASGKPVDRVHVSFVPLQENNPTHRNDLVDFSFSANSGSDGAFEMVVPAEPGHLLCSASDKGFISQAVGADALRSGKGGGVRRYFHGVLALDLKGHKGDKEVKLSLRRGVTVRGKLVGPDGKPVPRAMLFGPGELLAQPGEVRPVDFIIRSSRGQGMRALLVRNGRFELPGCDPERTYRVLIRDCPDLPEAVQPGRTGRENFQVAILLRESSRTGGTVPAGPALTMLLGKAKDPLGVAVDISAKKADGKPVTVKLVKCGSAQVRFVDAAGKPVQPNTGVAMEVAPRIKGKNPLAAETIAVRTYQQFIRLRIDSLPAPDEAGRFTLPALIPGVTYRIQVFDRRPNEILMEKEVTVHSGKTTRLADLVVKGPAKE